MPDTPESRRRRYLARKAAGLCVKCGSTTSRKRIFCDKCRGRACETRNARRANGQLSLRERRQAQGFCKECGNQKASGRKYCSACLERAKVKYQARKADGLCVLCGVQKSVPPTTKCAACATQAARRLRGWLDRLRSEVMNAYGGPRCVCCGETLVEFLTLDHKDGGGNQHRKEVRNQVYRWLKLRNFPPGFQVLCMNCNWAKGKYGECPHKRLSVAPKVRAA